MVNCNPSPEIRVKLESNKIHNFDKIHQDPSRILVSSISGSREHFVLI